MPLKCISEDCWRAAAQDGGTAYDLINAFSWSSAVDWPCPVKGVGDKISRKRDKTYCCNGWSAYYDSIIKNVDPYTSKSVALPPYITDYIAKMYVWWKLTGDANGGG